MLMSLVTARELLYLYENGIGAQRLSVSEEDIEEARAADPDDVVGFVAMDGKSYWFVNFEFARQNYEIDGEDGILGRIKALFACMRSALTKPRTQSKKKEST